MTVLMSKLSKPPDTMGDKLKTIAVKGTMGKKTRPFALKLNTNR